MGEGVPARMPGFRARCARARRPSGRCRRCGPTRGRGDAASDHRAGVRRGPACLEHALRRAPLGGPADAGRVRSAPMPKAGPSPPACARRPPRSAVQRDGKDGAGRHDVRRPGDGACAQTQGFRLPGTGCPRPGWRVTGAAGDGEVLAWSLVRKRTAGTCSGPLARRLGFPAQPARREEPAGDRPGEEGRCGPTDGAGRGVRGSRRHARRHLLADGERARRGRVQDPGSRPRAERWGREADLVVRPRHRGLRRLGRGARVNGAVDRRHREQGRLPGRKRDLDPAAQRRPHPAGLHRSRDAPPGADRGGTSSPGTRRRVGDRLSRR